MTRAAASKSFGSGPPVADALARDREAALALTPVSRETATRLDRYLALLMEWQRKTNLVAPSTLDSLWTRHVADSLQLTRLTPQAQIWVDLGSGGGFPGVVLACALAETPGATVHLVERNAKKAAFLREAARVTGAPALVHRADIGDFVDSFAGPVDCVTARALAPLKVLAGFIAPLIRRGARGLILKGQDIEAELTEAAKCWKIQAVRHPSLTDADACILEILQLEAIAAQSSNQAGRTAAESGHDRK
ncbi:MAG: 16S rRNA (guanine(527)-N(7))-methyltransferase RsmG [Xanthobacteraceae bacterium]|nr:MAG: 16S rRNA (guanine(527)-N(7))-methyltransferase RsmG [Xanthobacteraceae bacterium]